MQTAETVGEGPAEVSCFVRLVREDAKETRSHAVAERNPPLVDERSDRSTVTSVLCSRVVSPADTRCFVQSWIVDILATGIGVSAVVLQPVACFEHLT